MIVVDSSVWIDFFNGRDSTETGRLYSLLAAEPIAVGDLIVTEVLQGFRSDRDFAKARNALLSLTVFPLLGPDAAVRAAENYRELRKQGVTVRKTADVIIASFCIEHGHSLLFSDRDFLPFVERLGLARA
ncbi:PIN domain nuclease [Specibacter cremeus]|uniref:type II toxin-antitoxin system VapC family toxin n=1 Tax=Specibacter cremeus TaxID=1629051 RepID=UPI000F76D5B7|nr:PIN domain nuclease [Specibacter cremeus]